MGSQVCTQGTPGSDQVLEEARLPGSLPLRRDGAGNPYGAGEQVVELVTSSGSGSLCSIVGPHWKACPGRLSHCCF